MIGNQLIIRMEKDKSKSKRKLDQWDPPCDCDVIEIQRPTSKSGPKVLNANNNNRVLFRVQSKSHLGNKDDPVNRSQAISYEVRYYYVYIIMCIYIFIIILYYYII